MNQTHFRALTIALTIALTTALALTACKPKNDAAVMPPATSSSDSATLPPAPIATPANGMAVSALDLGNAVGGDNRVSSAMTSFATADTVYASVTTDATATGSLDAKWTYLGTAGSKAAPVQVHTESKQLAGGGATTHEFHVSKPDGWPPGRYRVEISHAGRVVQSKEFDVR